MDYEGQKYEVQGERWRSRHDSSATRGGELEATRETERRGERKKKVINTGCNIINYYIYIYNYTYVCFSAHRFIFIHTYFQVPPRAKRGGGGRGAIDGARNENERVFIFFSPRSAR